MLKCFPSVCEALGPTPNTTKKNYFLTQLNTVIGNKLIIHKESNSSDESVQTFAFGKVNPSGEKFICTQNDL